MELDVAGNQVILLLICCNDCSLVIDKLCDEAVEGDSTVVCFYFDFASRNEQSPLNMLGSLLKQLVSGHGEILEVIVKDFRKEKMSNVIYGHAALRRDVAHHGNHQENQMHI